jgi:hypothetical protein
MGVKLDLETEQVTGKLKNLQTEKFPLPVLFENIMWKVK